MSIPRSCLALSISCALAAACSSGSTGNGNGDAGNDAGNPHDAGPHDAGPVDAGPPPGAPVLALTTSITGAHLSWTLAGATGHETFAVWRAEDSGNFAPVAGLTGLTAMSAVDNQPGAALAYEVVASNAGGVAGEPSNSIAVQKAPGDVVAGGSDTRVLLIWSNVATAASYDVYRVPAPDAGGAPTLLANTASNNYIDDGSVSGAPLAVGEPYRYQVLAHAQLDAGLLDSVGSNPAATKALGIDIISNATHVSDAPDASVEPYYGSNLAIFGRVLVDGGAGVTNYPAISTKSAMVITGVPAGPYQIGLDNFPLYLPTSARSVDMSLPIQGRADLVGPTNLAGATTVTYAITGLDAWSDAGTDLVNVYSAGAANAVYSLVGGLPDGSAPAPGATTLGGVETVGVALDGGNVGDLHLVNGSEGDQLYLTQLRTRTGSVLEYDGRIRVRGSSLISRTMERFARNFVRKAIECLMADDFTGLHTLFVETATLIMDHRMPVSDFARVETLRDTLEVYREEVAAAKRNRSAAYEVAIAAERNGHRIRLGDRISYYVTGTDPNCKTSENCKSAEEWDPHFPDENSRFYLRRLDDLAEKFAVFLRPQDYRRIFTVDDLFPFTHEGIRVMTLPVQGEDLDKPDEPSPGQPGIWLDE